MRVIVSGDVLDDAASEVWELHELLGFACRDRHAVFFDPPSALEKCLATFEQSSRIIYERAISLAARKASTFPADVATIRIEVTMSSRWEDPLAVLPLREALAVLREPLGILLENADNDWNFLRGIMRRSERERMQRAVDEGWAAPLHGGGDTLQKQLEARLEVPRKGLRTFVMFDSDRLHPDELANTWTPVRPGHRPAACKAFEWEKLTRSKLPFRYWMLQRRFIESYIPKSELSKGASDKTPSGAVDAFYRMSRDARWYFNMKNGFDGDSKRHDKDRCLELYKLIIATPDHDLLKKGFGENLAEHYAESTIREFDWDPDALHEASTAIPRLMRLL